MSMGYDASVRFRQGSLRPVYAQVTVGEGGTAVVQAGGTFTLYDGEGHVEPGFNAVAVSGYEAGPQVAPKVWYVLNTAALAPGVYSGIFTFQAVGSDGITRTFDVDILITILADVEVTATYVEAELATVPLYQVRLHAGDVDMANALWSDAELSYFLTHAGGVPELAAAQALDALAVDRAKLANAVRIGAFGNGEAEAYRAIAERAQHLRAVAVVLPAVASPPAIFTRRHGNLPGTLDAW